MKYFKNHKFSLGFNWENNNMIYLLFFKILGGNCLILKFKEELWTTPNLKGEKCFYPKFVFVFLFFVCKTKRFYAWRKKKYKKSTQENCTWNNEFCLNKID